MHVCRRVRLNQNSLVCFGFILAVVKYAFASTAFRLPEWCDVVLMLAALSCFTLHIVRTQIKGKVFLIFLISLAVAVTVYLNNGHDDDLIILVVAVYALRDIDINKLIKSYSGVMLLFFVAVMCYSLFTGEHLGSYTEYRIERGYEYRYTFGFVHPNSLHGMYLRIACALLLTQWGRKHRRMKYIFLEVGNYLLFLFSDSRTGFIILTMVLLISFVTEYIITEFRRRRYLDIIRIFNIGIIAFTIFASINLKNFKVLVWLDSLCTGRFDMANRFLQKFPITFWGTDITYIDKSRYAAPQVLDCGIISTLLHYGVLVFGISIIIYMVGLKKIWRQYDNVAMAIVTGFITYSIFENSYSNIFTNLGLLLCCYYIVNDRLFCYRWDEDYG